MPHPEVDEEPGTRAGYIRTNAALPSGTLPVASAAGRRWAELLGIFVFLPLLLVWLRPGRAILPVLWAGTVAVAVALVRDPSFDRSVLSLRRVADGRWVGRLARWAVATAALGAVLVAAAPDRLWALPRRSLALWAAVMVLYPFLSVVPQTLVYRVFFLHRYAGLLDDRRLDALAALAFGLAHVVFLNPVAPLLSLAGGALFVRTYRTTGSMWASAAEHALYGASVMTVGWGTCFYHGSIATAQAWLWP